MEEPSIDELRRIYEETRTIAAVGASAEPAKAGGSIPAYLQSHGYRIVPVSPKGGEIFGERVYTSVSEIDVPVDVVDVFRPAEEAPGIAREAAAIGAKVLWLQTGVVSEEAARIASEAGMKVVMDRCMGATHSMLGLGAGPE
jgi:predicted CoA-binding protein